MSRVCNYCPRKNLTDADFYSTRNTCKQCAIAKNGARYRQLRFDKKCMDCLGPTDGSPRCPEHTALNLARYHANIAANQKKAKERRQRLKRAALAAYGGARCVCCGERHIEFLTIDHIDGNGAAHRREMLKERGWHVPSTSMSGAHFYTWLAKHSFPPGFRVLCMNCNTAHGHFGYCPHESSAKATISVN